jgi:peptidoglycan/xylan/chitin deacetylase (PgdA/CDA1 family)
VAARLAPEALRAGDIVLLHESQDWTLAALPRVLEGLARGGLQAVTVSELLEPGGAA